MCCNSSSLSAHEWHQPAGKNNLWLIFLHTCMYKEKLLRKMSFISLQSHICTYVHMYKENGYGKMSLISLHSYICMYIQRKLPRQMWLSLAFCIIPRGTCLITCRIGYRVKKCCEKPYILCYSNPFWHPFKIGRRRSKNRHPCLNLVPILRKVTNVGLHLIIISNICNWHILHFLLLLNNIVW
jgi:hypothetical protein